MVRSLLARFTPKYERRLLALCLNNPNNDPDTDEWNKNAVRCLVRELKKDLELIDELERAILEKSIQSKCIPVKKTSEKRLLISHRRGSPQVIYCRLWRWPDLQSHHQIKAISSCESNVLTTQGVDQPNNSSTICINPYHYERHQPAPIEPILVALPKIPPDLTSSFEDSGSAAKGTKARPGDLSLYHSHSQDSSTMHPDQPPPPPQPQQQPGRFYQQQPQQLAQQPPQLGHQPSQLGQHINQQPQQIGQIPQQMGQQPAQHLQLSPQYQQSPGQTQGQDLSPHQQHEHHQHHQHHHQQQQQLPPHQHPQHQHTQHPQHTQLQHPHLQQQLPQQQHHHQHHQQLQQQLQPQQLQLQQLQSMQPQPPQQQAQQRSPHAQTQQQQYGPSAYQTQSEFIQPQAEQQYEHLDLSQYQATSTQEYSMNPSMMYYHAPYAFQQDLPNQTVSPMMVTEMSVESEVARPYRFRQNRFAHMARARQEHSVSGNYPRYEPQSYVSSQYQYSTQYSPNLQAQYQARSTLTGQHPVPPHAPINPAGMSAHTYIRPPTGPPYQSQYVAQQQAQFAQQHQQQQTDQMQLDYPTEPVVTVRSPTGAEYYIPGQSDQTPIIDIQEVPYAAGTYWCSISYHEYDQRIGEKYHSNCRTVSVDGYTQPMCSDRFCIGGISNINRNQFTEWVRRRIGRGVKLTFIDGEVHVEGCSESSIFVSNPLQLEEDGDIMIEHVSKLTLGCTAKVFSTQQFAKLLAEAVVKGFESVYKLTGRCVIRVSFVKGWGRNYKRQSIFNTPCWVEVQLNGPLQWIDKALRQMKPPTGIGSTS